MSSEKMRAVVIVSYGGVEDLDLAPANMSLPLDPHRNTYLNAPLLSSKPSNRNYQSS